MTDRREPGRDPLSSLRDELGDQFLRVARNEPRSRIRRRLRYAGLALVGTLLVVPATVALSGDSSGRPLATSAPGSFAECDEAGLPPLRAVAPGAVAPRVRELRALRYEVQPSPGGLRYRIRPSARHLDELDVRIEPPRRRLEACGPPTTAPLLPKGGRRAELEALPSVAVPVEPPAALRSRCLTIRVEGETLEARHCAEPAPAPAPAPALPPK